MYEGGLGCPLLLPLDKLCSSAYGYAQKKKQLPASGGFPKWQQYIYGTAINRLPCTCDVSGNGPCIIMGVSRGEALDSN